MSNQYLTKLCQRYQTQAESLCLLDSNVWLGKPAGFSLAQELSPERLEQALVDYYIKGALVSHWRSKTISAQDGNRILLKTEFKNKNIFFVWTGVPLLKGEREPLPSDMALSTKVRAVRVFPKAHNFAFTPWCVGLLCEWLIEHNIPLFVWHVEIDWRDLYSVAKAFPALKIIVETQTQKILYHTRTLFSLLKCCENISVELSNFAGQGFIEYVVREFGADRLFFGSFLPVNDPLVPISMLIGADISEQDKQSIAHKNIETLINGVKI